MYGFLSAFVLDRSRTLGRYVGNSSSLSVYSPEHDSETFEPHCQRWEWWFGRRFRVKGVEPYGNLVMACANLVSHPKYSYPSISSHPAQKLVTWRLNGDLFLSQAISPSLQACECARVCRACMMNQTSSDDHGGLLPPLTFAGTLLDGRLGRRRQVDLGGGLREQGCRGRPEQAFPPDLTMCFIRRDGAALWRLHRNSCPTAPAPTSVYIPLPTYA